MQMEATKEQCFHCRVRLVLRQNLLYPASTSLVDHFLELYLEIYGVIAARKLHENVIR